MSKQFDIEKYYMDYLDDTPDKAERVKAIQQIIRQSDDFLNHLYEDQECQGFFIEAADVERMLAKQRRELTGGK